MFFPLQGILSESIQGYFSEVYAFSFWANRGMFIEAFYAVASAFIIKGFTEHLVLPRLFCIVGFKAQIATFPWATLTAQLAIKRAG